MTLQQLLDAFTANMPTIEVKDNEGTIIKFTAYSDSAFNADFLAMRVQTISIRDTTTLEVTVESAEEEE